MSSPPDPGGPSRVRRTPTAVGPANQSRGSGGSDQIHLDSNLPPAAEDSRGSERGGLPIHMGVLGFRGRMLPNLEEIPRLRRALGLSQPRLASMVGISQSAVAKIERGKTNPSYAVVKRLFECLDAERRAAGARGNRRRRAFPACGLCQSHNAARGRGRRDAPAQVLPTAGDRRAEHGRESLRTDDYQPHPVRKGIAGFLPDTGREGNGGGVSDHRRKGARLPGGRPSPVLRGRSRNCRRAGPRDRHEVRHPQASLNHKP